MDSRFFSRERAAGYEPERLAATRALLVGAGALGQNCAISLTLCQIGELCVVDFDRFEPHNATRSPCFPSQRDSARWGNSKAEIVARKLSELISWSESPRISYLAGPIQEFGDAPFRNATVVISAVDSNRARAYIASMCKKHKRPLVEGGFDGPDVSFSVLANNPRGPCWLCHQAMELHDQLRLSCTARAMQAEQDGFVPATQPAAAVLGALMAEAVIQVAHGNDEVLNRRVYVNTRTARVATIRLTMDEDCQGRHDWPDEVSFWVTLSNDARGGDLLEELAKRMPGPRVMLPHRFIAAAPCAGCGRPVEIKRPDWALSNNPLCVGCGGPWQRCNGGTDGSPLLVYSTLDQDSPLLDLPLGAIGIPPGSVLEAEDLNDHTAMFGISGTVSSTLVYGGDV